MAIARTRPGSRLVRVFDIGQSGETVFLTMELSRGESLRELLSRGPLAPERAVGIGTEVLHALADLHRLGIVHRDVKPGNILIAATGEVKLADFGLARHWEGAETRVTEPEGLVGTVEYLSPEQALGDLLDARSDLYSFGVVLFEMLAGKVPLRGDSAIGTIVAHIPPGAARREEGPAKAPVARGVVARLLAKDQERRYATADDVLADLEARRARRAPAGSAGASSWAGRRRSSRRSFSWRSCRSSRGTSRACRASFRTAPGESRRSTARAGSSGGARTRNRAGAWRSSGSQRGVPRPSPSGAASPSRRRRSRSSTRPPAGPSRRCRSPTRPTRSRDSRIRTFRGGSVRLRRRRGRRRRGRGDAREQPALPSATYVCDLSGRQVLAAFYGSGHHYAAAATDVDGDGRKELVLTGYNNRMGYSGAVAAFRVPKDGEVVTGGTQLPSAESPDRPSWEGWSPHLAWYALVPLAAVGGERPSPSTPPGSPGYRPVRSPPGRAGARRLPARPPRTRGGAAARPRTRRGVRSPSGDGATRRNGRPRGGVGRGGAGAGEVPGRG
ncbi:MAG: serine/threonine protein kinase [Holophagales bacterium]|nr:serine/threonine protein kinase [Holophagales bacterium]